MHEYKVGFLVHKDMVSAVLGCRPLPSRLIAMRLKAAPFNVTIIQVYAPTSGHDDNKVDNFYRQLQEIIYQTPKKNILVEQGDWDDKIGRDAQQIGETYVDSTLMRRLMRDVSDF